MLVPAPGAKGRRAAREGQSRKYFQSFCSCSPEPAGFVATDRSAAAFRKSTAPASASAPLHRPPRSNGRRGDLTSANAPAAFHASACISSPEASRNWTRNRTVNAREDDRPRRPSPDHPHSRMAMAADRAPSASGSRYRGRLRGLFAWPLPARRAASERVCGLDASSRQARSRHVRVGEPPNRPRRHGRVSAPPRRRQPP